MYMGTVLDTETTDLNGEVVEIASVMVNETGNIIENSIISHLIKPVGRIGLQAMAVHSITEEMVSEAPVLAEVVDEYFTEEYLIMHNAKFDMRMVGEDKFIGHKVICTHELAKKLGYKEKAGSTANMVLYYYFGGYKEFIPEGVAHRAGYDSQITAYILKKMMDENNLSTLNDVYEYMNQPAPFVCTFKKHSGKLWEDVVKEDYEYVEWMIDNFKWKNEEEKEKVTKLFNKCKEEM